MLNGKKIIVVLPAYNAEKTLKITYEKICKDVVDDIILIDDFSCDNTVETAKQLNISTIVHEKNMGYGANQKTCYTAALQLNADIVIMLHPDYQYSPELIPAMAAMLAYGKYDAVIASRMLTGDALKNGMPFYKWISNKFLTGFENLFTKANLSEYHSGYRGFTKEVLEKLPLESCDNDFIFDNEMLALIIYNNFKIGEISCPAKYFPEASSINFRRSCKYGFGVLGISVLFLLAKIDIFKAKIFKQNAKKLDINRILNWKYKVN